MKLVKVITDWIEGKDLSQTKTWVKWVLFLIWVLAVAIGIWGCSAQYAHRMTYQNGEETVTMTCETEAQAKK